jgi:hypothetical protein
MGDTFGILLFNRPKGLSLKGNKDFDEWIEYCKKRIDECMKNRELMTFENDGILSLFNFENGKWVKVA